MTSPSPPPPSLRSRLATAAVAFVLVVALLEPAFRLARWIRGRDRGALVAARGFFLGQRLPFVEAWPFVNFQPFPGADPLWRGGGFRSSEDVPLVRTRPTIRIAFIGGSTTAYGFALAYRGSFPEQVEQRLRRAGVPVEVMNCGVVAWSSAENLVHYALSVQDYAPDWVIIHQGANDAQARWYPDFRPDYGHYRRPVPVMSPSPLDRLLARWSDLYVWFLLRHGTVPRDLDAAVNRPLPPPADLRLNPAGVATFRRNTQSLVHLAQAGGARVLLTTESHNRRPRTGETHDGLQQAMDEANAAIRDLAREMHLPLADTEAVLETHPDVFTDYVHVSPEGNRLKARAILRVLARAGLGRPHR
jgi:lysophospholipase L1-like esterase